jgi:hypothetical protein
VALAWLGFASMDGALFVLFAIAYLRTPKGPPRQDTTATAG